MRTLHIITTGGTIEKSYSEIDGVLANHTSIIRQVITNDLRLPFTQLKFYDILSKDSLEITDKDRELLISQIQTLLKLNDPILVLHGTDTMVQSAQVCYDTFKDLKVALVFTGAMRPIGFVNSDGKQNIIEALYAAKILKPGVYISFHGEAYMLPNVEKNRVLATFQETQFE